MLLITHVIIALGSMLFTTYTYISPSKNRLYVSQALVALTLVSGTYLVISTKANMIRACATGLIYLAIISFGIVVIQRKLATENNKKLK